MDSNDKSSKIYEKTEYNWVINDFSKLMNEYKFGTFIESPVFPGTFEGSKYRWKLRFYPNGFVIINSPVLFLFSASCFECFAEIWFSMRNSNDDLIIKHEYEFTFEKNDRSFCFVTPRTQNILTSLQEDNVIIAYVFIRAEIQSYHIPHVQEKENSTLALSPELDTMLDSFLFKFEDDSAIKVHPYILARRSPVFSAMFEHDTLEKSSGFAKIKDIEKKTMVALLNFIYTGVVDDLSFDEAKKLVYAANKYLLDGLTLHCGNILANYINVSNALEILQLADRYNLLLLKNKTLDYIVKSKNFSHRSQLRPLERSNPQLITELLMKLKIQ